MSTGPIVKVSVEEGVAIVTIDRPPVNALNRQTIQELDQMVTSLKADQAVKVVILTGGGSFAFVAGADIKEISQLRSGQEAAEVAAQGQAVIMKIQRLGKPVIAAINGVCLGGGNELAMACHLRIAGDRARFGQPEISLGIMPGFGGTQRVPGLVGEKQAPGTPRRAVSNARMPCGLQVRRLADSSQPRCVSICRAAGSS